MESCHIDYLKNNIIDWYDFKDNANLLGIGENIQEYSNTLNKKLAKVILLENFTPNTQIEEEKFDYIFIKEKIETLEYVKKFLKQDGTILLLCDNRFGIRYFAGDKYDNQAFSTICKDSNELLSKKEIEDFLNKQGFSNYRFFYPLPNYNIANVIFSDNYLPDYTDTKLICNNIYNKESLLVFNESEVLRQLTKDEQFKNFTNSYFVEINPKTEIKFASFNNVRKKEYQLCTKIYPNYVIKTPTNQDAQNHILNMKNYIADLKEHGINIIDKFQEDAIVSEYISQKSLYETIVENISQGNQEEVYKLIRRWYNFIKSKFESDRVENLNENITDVDEKIVKDLFIVKKAYIDLVFENAFFVQDEFVFFDQEWCIDNLPLEFILYRGICNIYTYHSELENVLPIKELFDQFDITNFLALFQKIERFIQKQIIDDEVNNIYVSSKKMVFDVIQELSVEKIQLSEKINLLIEEKKQKENYIAELTAKLENANEVIEALRQEEKKKEEYIISLQEEIKQRDKIIAECEHHAEEREKTIYELNEIIKVKDNQISIYENMKTVKWSKRLRGLKNGHE